MSLGQTAGTIIGKYFGGSSGSGSTNSGEGKTSAGSGVDQVFGTGGVNIGTKSQQWTTTLIIVAALIAAAIVLRGRK